MEGCGCRIACGSSAQRRALRRCSLRAKSDVSRDLYHSMRGVYIPHSPCPCAWHDGRSPVRGVRSMAEKVRHFLHVAEVQDISVSALSEKSGVPKCMMYRYANGDASPRIKAMRRIANALGCDIAEAFPEVFTVKPQDIKTKNIKAGTPISTGKMARRYGLTTAALNDILQRAGIQQQMQDGSWRVTGDYTAAAVYRAWRDEHGDVRLLTFWTTSGQKCVRDVLDAYGFRMAGVNVGSSERPTR